MAQQPDNPCPTCGHLNLYTARICGNCKSAMVQTAPPPSQPNAITVRGTPLDPTTVPDPEPIEALPLRPTMVHRRRGLGMGRAHGMANQLRQVAMGAEVEDRDEKPWYLDWKIGALAVAFLTMVGKNRGDGEGVGGFLKELFD